MGHDENRILYLIEKLRSITLTIQVMPFAFSALYIMSMFLYLTASDSVCCVLDTLFYVSPTTVAGMLICSRVLKLCKWHKMACSLPLLPQVTVFIDYHIVELSRFGAYLSVSLSIVMAVLLLIAAYNVFLKPNNNERKRRVNRDARLLQIQSEEGRLHDGRD